MYLRLLTATVTFGLLLMALFPPLLQAADPVHHALVRFHVDTPGDRAWMDANHLRFQRDMYVGGVYYDLLVKPADLAEVMSSGSRVELVHDDVESFWASRIESGDANGGGVWGDFHTYSETVAWIDNLHQMYPEVISAKWSIGQGHDGNDIWVFRVSDNPDIDESGEPEVLFDGLHHANEIMGLELVGMLAEYLAEQYDAGNPEIIDLLNQNEVYMIPMLNPDGLIYNELTYPGGGASWRKNRRDNGGGAWGVDLNRNYTYEWGCDEGSSGDPYSSTYRGPSAGSEPEVVAVTAFIDEHEFVTRQSYHAAGDATLYPWGFTTGDTVDEDIFREMAGNMVLYNGYRAGQPGDPGMYYITCGDAFDWDYGDTSVHEKIFALTNEVGTSQWPSTSQRQSIFDDNLWPAIYLIQVASSLRSVSWAHVPLPFTGSLGEEFDVTAVPTGYEGLLIDPSTVMLHYRINGGVLVDQAMIPTGQPGEYGATIPAQPKDSVVEYYLSASDVGDNVGTSPRNAPSVLHYFEIGNEFEHAMEQNRGWTAGSSDDDAIAGLWVRTDPVGTDAQPEDDHSAVGTHCWVTGQHTVGESIGSGDVDGGKTTLFSPVYDMTGAETVTFAYWRWYSNDQGSGAGQDWWDVDLSNDGGETWVSLEHTQTSSNAWLEADFDLADYFAVPGQVRLRFVAADEGAGSIVEGAVDDFTIAGVFDVTGVEDLPSAFELEMQPNFPNPFHPTTTVRFQIPAASLVKVGIYDTGGRMVRSLAHGVVDPGEYSISWNGTDAMGRPVAAGVYFARLSTESGELSTRMVLAK